MKYKPPFTFKQQKRYPSNKQLNCILLFILSNIYKKYLDFKLNYNMEMYGNPFVCMDSV